MKSGATPNKYGLILLPFIHFCDCGLVNLIYDEVILNSMHTSPELNQLANE